MIRGLVAEGVDRVFGYPGGAIIPVYDKLYDYTDSITHVLTRHEQGAIHAAQGYARVSGRTGVVIVTSGPLLSSPDRYFHRCSAAMPFRKPMSWA